MDYNTTIARQMINKPKDEKLERKIALEKHNWKKIMLYFHMYVSGLVLNITLFIVTLLFIFMSYKILNQNELTYIIILFLMGFTLSPIFYIIALCIILIRDNQYLSLIMKNLKNDDSEK